MFAVCSGNLRVDRAGGGGVRGANANPGGGGFYPEWISSCLSLFALLFGPKVVNYVTNWWTKKPFNCDLIRKKNKITRTPEWFGFRCPYNLWDGTTDNTPALLLAIDLSLRSILRLLLLQRTNFLSLNFASGIIFVSGGELSDRICLFFCSTADENVTGSMNQTPASAAAVHLPRIFEWIGMKPSKNFHGTS